MNPQKLKQFPKSQIWDKRTQQTVDRLRAFIHREPQPTLSYIQGESLKARPLKGPFNALQETLPIPPEDDVRQLMLETIADLGEAEFEPPAIAPVPVEWIVNSDHQDEQPTSGGENDGNVTILHVHGGAFLYVPTISIEIFHFFTQIVKQSRQPRCLSSHHDAAGSYLRRPRRIC